MISIIISSYSEKFYNSLHQNINESCDVVFEIIKIDNPGLYGICEAYNIGAKKAQYDKLLFLHEDVLIKSKNWGSILCEYLDNDNTGIIGIAGGDYVPCVPTGWFTDERHSFINIIQGNKNNNELKSVNTLSLPKKEVLMVDGVFMGIRKKVFDEFKFDENLKGFHGYDTELSLRLAKKYKNYVVSDILVHHFSKGSFQKEYYETNIYIRKKLGSDFNSKIDSYTEYRAFEHFILLKKLYKFPLIYLLRFFPYGKISIKQSYYLLINTVKILKR